MKTTLRSLITFASVLTLLQACTPSSSDSPIVSGSADAGVFQNRNVNGHTLGLNGTKKLVLTFDDGPFPGVTNQVLDYVREQGLKVSFFLVGKNIDGNESLLRRMADEGHTIGNHTFNHRPLVAMGRRNMNDVYREIADTDAKISPFVRADSRFYFRAPGGTFNPKKSVSATVAMNSHANLQKYIGPVYWDIGGQVTFVDSTGRPSANNSPTQYMNSAADWECWQQHFSVQTCADAYLREAELHQGGVVLMHDHDIRTLEMIKILIPEWKRRGFTFVDLDQVPGMATLQ